MLYPSLAQPPIPQFGPGQPSYIPDQTSPAELCPSSALASRAIVLQTEPAQPSYTPAQPSRAIPQPKPAQPSYTPAQISPAELYPSPAQPSYTLAQPS